MRFWELALVAALAVFAVWPVITGRPRRPWGYLPGIFIVGALIMHVREEGIRWQMYAVYLVAVATVVAIVWDAVAPQPDDGTPPGGRIKAANRALGAVVGIGVLAAPALLLPVVVMSPPAGPVGTVVFHAIDGDRLERYGPTPGQPREVAVQVWYPAVANENPQAKFVDQLDEFAPAAAEYLGFPAFTLGHLEYAEMGSTVGPEVADGSTQYPVLLYSHGWGGFKSVAFNEAEALAASGYVVIAVDHTYGALVTSLSGATAALDPQALPEADEVGDVAYAAASQQLVDTFREDLDLALEIAEELAAGSHEITVLAGRIDMESIGVWGHSTGGGAAIEFCGTDDRCDAVYGLDPWVEPVDVDLLVRGIEIPLAAIRSEEWTDRPNEVPLAALFEASPLSEPLRCITGTAHRDFTLLPRLSPLTQYLGMSGTLSPERSSALVETQLVSFFDRELKGVGDGTAGLDAPEIVGCG